MPTVAGRPAAGNGTGTETVPERAALTARNPVPAAVFARGAAGYLRPVSALRTRSRLTGAVLVVAALVAGLGTVVLPARQAHATVAPGRTERVSVADDGSQGTAPPNTYEYSFDMSAAISADGRYVAFSDTTPLDPLITASNQDGQLSNIYVRDRNAPGHTVLISRAELAPADGLSFDPSISANGRYVAFDTTAANLPDGDTDPDSDVVICDRDPEGDGILDKRLPDGAMDYRYIVIGRRDVDSFGRRLWDNGNPSMSADGRTVAWLQTATNESSGPSVVVARLNGEPNGQLSTPPESAYVDVAAPNPNEVYTSSSAPALSADGQHVVFATDYCADCSDGVSSSAVRTAAVLDAAVPSNGTALYADDLGSRQVVRVDVDATGQPLSGEPSSPTVSGDGHLVAFTESDQTGDALPQIAVVNRDPNATGQLGPGNGAPVAEYVASETTAGTQGEGESPALSSDGRYLAFVTNASDMDDGANGPIASAGQTEHTQVVARDLVVDAQRSAAGESRLAAELVSPSILTTCDAAGQTCPGDADSSAPVEISDGGATAFVSSADDLVPGDTNNLPDVFVRQFLPTITAGPLDFGTVAFGATSVATVVVRQNGFGPVPIGALTILGPDAQDFTVFPVQNCQNVILYETGTCLVSVQFDPSGPGTRSATLQLDSPIPVGVPLTGGVGPPVNGFAAQPDPLLYNGQRLALTSSSPQTIQVTNTSAAPLTISAVTPLGGPGLYPGDYLITADTCAGAVLAPGTGCAVTVINVPHGAGIRPGALEFVDDTGGSPQLVGLFAVGTTPTLTANPAVVPTGRVTTVTGQGFPANSQIVLTIPDLPGAATVTATTNSLGEFTSSLPVFAHSEIGTWSIQANSTATSETARTPVLIVLDTFQPPDFTDRG